MERENSDNNDKLQSISQTLLSKSNFIKPHYYYSLLL